MSKRLLITMIMGLILTGFVVFGELNLAANCPTASIRAESQGPTTTVTVLLDGLMVYRRVGDNFDYHYEVGILEGKNTAICHHLRIGRPDHWEDENHLAQLAESHKVWKLEVVSGNVTKPRDITARQNGPFHRLDDTQNTPPTTPIPAPTPPINPHFYDFGWVMDLERDFNNGKELKMRKKRLKPIIELNNGDLYVEYNYDELERFKGASQTSERYGFASDLIALNVELKTGEKLVLRAGSEIVFSLPDNNITEAGIFNAPPFTPKDKKDCPAHKDKKDEPGEQSHFQYYYNLFEVRPQDQYRLQVYKDSEGYYHRPPNYFPHSPDYLKPTVIDEFFHDVRIACFDNQMCGAVFLGKSNEPLVQDAYGLFSKSGAGKKSRGR